MSIITYNGESKVIKRICELLDTMSGINFEVVQTLPLVDISTSTIYLVPKQTAQTDNIYDEYINTDGTSQGWELIGTTEIDLSNYYTKTEVDNLIPTDFVPKSTGGTFDGNVNIVRANSGTTNVNSVISLGNNKAVGTTGNTRGVLQLYDQNGKFTNLFPSDNASNLSYFLPNDKPNNSVLATTDDAEKVKQTNVTNSAVYRVLLSKSATDNEETDTVNKSYTLRLNTGNGYLYLDRTHTSTSVQEEALIIGNSKADGTEGANSGILRMYGRGAYYAQFRDLYNYLTANRIYLLRDATGMLGLYSDCAEFGVKANLNELDNLLYPPYFHSSGNYPNSTNPTMTYSTNFETGEYTVKGYDTVNRALNLKRYTSGFYLPAGKYKLSGCPSGGSSSKYSLRIYSATEQGQTTGIGSDYGSGLEFTLTERTLMQIVFYVNANQSVDFTFRPKLERLSEWVDLGSLASAITVDDVYSEYMADLEVIVSYLGNSYTRNFTVNVLANMITSTEKIYYNGDYCLIDSPNFLFATGGIKVVKQNNQVTITKASNGGGQVAGGTQYTIATGGRLYAKA